MKEHPRPDFDEARAQALLGKSVLIGLTYLDHDGWILEQRQLHGTIVSFHRTRGFGIRLAGKRSGETYTLPPDTRAFEEANPGEYRLRSTGEIVVDPDFISTWTITKGGNEHEA